MTTRMKTDLPTRNGAPLIGNVHQFFKEGVAFYEKCAPLGDVVAFELVNTPGLVIADPDLVRQVLVDKNEKFVKGRFVEDNFGHAAEGVFAIDGAEWEHRRSLLQTAFRPNFIQQYCDEIRRITEEIADRLDRRRGEVVEFDYLMDDLALSVLTSTLYGVKEDPEMHERIHQAVDDILLRFDGTSINTFLPPWLPTRRNIKYRRGLSDLHDVIDELIARRRESKLDGHDLLSVLLRSKAEDDRITDEVIRDELVTFTLAGHDTTSLALTYTWHLLGKNPETFERLTTELDAELAGEPPQFEQFGDLEYLEKVIQEGLRVYPPVTQLFRETAEEVTLGDYTVPEGVIIVTPQWTIHRDERYYDEPDRFRPERWDGSLEDSIPEYAYFPFGGGPRHCIGMRFGMTEMKIVIGTLAQRFRFEPAYESLPETNVALTLQPKDAVEMRVRPREQ